MYYFSVPCDFSKHTIDQLAELNRCNSVYKVKEVYGQATDGDLSMSGRMLTMLPAIDFSTLVEFANYCRKKGIGFHYCFNASCLGNDEFVKEKKQKIKNYILRLYNAGIRSFTVTMPSLMELISNLGLDIEIKASAICEIMSVERALFYQEKKATRIVLDPDIYRDFRQMKNIVRVFGSGTEILLNNLCIRNCGYKKFHYDHEAHSVRKDQSIRDYYINRCYLQKAKNPLALLHINWIRPEDLPYYQSIGISHFKIQGRHSANGTKLIKTLLAYFEHDFSGNLMDLLMLFQPYQTVQPYLDNKKLDGFLERFVTHPELCTGICSECGYCHTYMQKALDLEDTNSIQSKTRQFFGLMDQFHSIGNDMK